MVQVIYSHLLLDELGIIVSKKDFFLCEMATTLEEHIENIPIGEVATYYVKKVPLMVSSPCKILFKTSMKILN